MADPSYIQITNKSVLQLRGITQDEAIQLSGSTICLNGSVLQLGRPSIRVLQPSSRLVSRMVILDLENFAGNLMAEITQKTGETPSVLIGRRRALPFKDGKHLLGHAVEIRGLSEAGCLTLMKIGLGKCRSMGCGVLRPYDDRA
jgi:hypothetical protein